MPCGPRAANSARFASNSNSRAGGVPMLRPAEQSKLTPTDPNPFVHGLASTPQRVRAFRGPRAMDARVVRVLEIVARELEKPQSVKVLAARLRLSPSRFEHLFKRWPTGRSKLFFEAHA